MIKSIKNKKIGKRILAVFLAVIMCFSCFIPAFAFTSSVTEWNRHHRFTVDGKDAFCINYGVSSSGQFATDEASKSYWKSLGSTVQTNIKAIISCADYKGYLNSSDDATYFGVQRAIWSVINGKSEQSEANGGLSDWFKGETKSVYDDLKSDYSKFNGTRPDLGKGIELKSVVENDTTVYVGSGADTNKVLSKEVLVNNVKKKLWKISDKGGLNHVSFSGNTVNVRNKTSFDGAKKVSLASEYQYYSDIEIGRFGVQEAIAVGTPKTLTYGFLVSSKPLNYGSISVTKRDDSGNPLAGVQFNIYDANGNFLEQMVTNDAGYAQSGQYTEGTILNVYEIVPDGYTASVYYTSVNVEYRPDNSAKPISNDGSGYWTNVRQRGDIHIHKVIENLNIPCIADFALYDAWGNEVLRGTTDSSGELYFCNVPTGIYTLKEINIPNNVIGWRATYANGQLVSSDGCQITVSWDNQGSYPYINQVNHNGWLNDVVGSANLCEWINQVEFSGSYGSILNRYKRGDLRVHKTEEIATDSYQGGQYQNGNGFEITITSKASDNVMGVDLTYAMRTGSDGYAYFCDIPVGTYTVSETNLDAKFVQPASQTVYVDWDCNTSYKLSGNTSFKAEAQYFNENGKTISFTNILKRFRIQAEKVDSETGKTAQGNGSLAGAVYELYRGNTLLGTYTTDSNGSFTTEYFVFGVPYVLREKTAPEGYQVDKNKYIINNHSGENYTVELNDLDFTLEEDAIKGQIQLFKYTDDNDESEINPVEPDAEFEIYLKSAGSYDNCAESERDYLVTDENGIATSKSLPFGTYVVHQTKGTEGHLLVDDFEVFIDTNGKVYRYFHIENHVTELYLKVIKRDIETNKVIPYNEAQGAMFQILDKDGNVVKLKNTYPTVETIDTFTINSQGYLMLPEKLKYGKYYLVEVQSPYGYYNPNYDVNDPKIVALTDENGNTTYNYDFNDVYKIPFNISENDTEIYKTETGSDVESEIKYITVNVYNQNQMGVINITKQGEVFSSVTKLGDTYTPQYEVRGLAGAEYTITAKEDIVTPDGTVRYHKGDVVDVITTDENGFATSKQLYLGEYALTETKTPHGYVNNGEAQNVTLTYKGQQYSLIDTSATFNNERQKCSIDGTKSIEKDKLYDIGNNGEIENIKFGLFASQEMKATDGKVIPKDGLIEAVYVTSDGKIEFTADLPVDYKYYVKEISTDEHYKLDSTKYEINFTYQGENVSKVDLKINNGKTINNSIIRGDIVGNKVDEAGRNLYGAKFGLFKSDETEFIEKNAYLVSASAKDGHFEFKDVPYGNYQIKELSAPENYIYSEEPIIVSVEKDKQEINLGDIENILAKGTIEIEKTGEVFSSVIENEDGTFTPVYTKENLEGVTFDVIAAEDIYSYFGDKLVSKGDVVDTVTTDKNGVARTTELYFGKYYVVEKETLDGFVLDDTKHEVVLHYIDNDTPIVVESVSLENTRQKAEISLTKEMEKDSIFNLGDNNEIANVVFGLFAGEDLTATDGLVIEKDSILETATTDENGHIVFKTDVPYGYKYYVKELTTDKHYSLFNDEIKFEYTTDDNSSSLIEIKINDGKVIINELLRGKIVGHKTDENGKNLAGATFGLFYADETEFTEDNAILTAVSDENGLFYFEYVDYGDYVVREIKAPEGYVLNEQSFNVSITKHEQEVNIDCSNKLIRGSILINKIDSEYPENTLSGAEFCMYEDTNRNGILDSNEAVLTTIPEVSKGVYRLDNVPYGYYLIKETKAPVGFSLDENIYPLYISENGATYEIKNNGQCFIDNALTGSLKIIKTSSDKNIEGFEFLIEGTSDSGIPVSMVVKTNKDGVIDITPLRTGTYTITELENDLTDRYVLPEAQTITINANETTEVKFFNRVKQGTIVITKTDVATGKVIPFCKIEILDEDGNVVAQGVTDENGVVEFLLDYGTYYYREYEAPEGYILDETMHKFEISEDGQVIKAEITNEAEATSPKTGTEIAAIGLTVIISSIALGTYLMYLKKRKKSTDK